MSKLQENRCDVLVVGGGLAGGIAALKAASTGAKVILASKCIEESASRWAQGGVVYRAENDPVSLRKDILEAGAGQNYLPAVDLLVNEGPAAVEHWLQNVLKVPFDVDSQGNVDLALEAAHHSARILHVKDSTGHAIMSNLDAALKASENIVRLDASLVDLLLSNRHDARRERRFEPTRVLGGYFYFPESKEVQAILAASVVLCTGGFSRLFLHATGPSALRGDGISAAHRAGAKTIDLEYIQFHPTAFYQPAKARRLLTEALRGEGARILNLAEEEFVDNLAARDVVARAIHEEMLRSGGEHVWLDCRNVASLAERFPTIDSFLKEEGYDASRDLVPVVPAAHYCMGGVWTGLDGATSVRGLFAAGEVACTGLHGANRLASTSLLEAVVFGERAGAKAASFALEQPDLNFELRPWKSQSAKVDPALMQQDWQLLRQTMWNYVGLVRSEKRLRRAERILIELRTEVESFYNRGTISDELIGLRHAVLVATLTLYAALRNGKSRGSHYLKDD